MNNLHNVVQNKENFEAKGNQVIYRLRVKDHTCTYQLSHTKFLSLRQTPSHACQNTLPIADRSKMVLSK